MAAQGMHPGTPTMDTTTSMIPQLTTQMGQLQIGTGTSVRIRVIHKWQHFFISKIIHILWILSENWLANYVLGEKMECYILLPSRKSVMLVDIIFRKLKFINDDTNRRNVRLKCEKKIWTRWIVLEERADIMFVFACFFAAVYHGSTRYIRSDAICQSATHDANSSALPGGGNQQQQLLYCKLLNLFTTHTKFFTLLVEPQIIYVQIICNNCWITLPYWNIIVLM